MKVFLIVGLLLTSFQIHAGDSFFAYSDSDYAKKLNDTADLIAADYEYGVCFVGNPEEAFRDLFSLGDRISYHYEGDAIFEVTSYTIAKTSIEITFMTYDNEDDTYGESETLYFSECK